MAILGGGRACKCAAGEALPRVFVTKPLLKLPSASLAAEGKASVHFAGLWVGP